MPLIVSPKHLGLKSDLYHQLANLINAGIGIIQAAEIVEESPPAPSLRKPVRRLIDELKSGGTLTEGVRHLGTWMPEFDRAIIEAAETSGRIEECFHSLSEHYKERALLAKSVISQLIYPMLILHIAVFIFPVDSLIGLLLRGEVQAFFLSKAMVLLPMYAILFGLLYMLQEHRGYRWRTHVESILHWTPVLGKARRNLALSHLSGALEALLNAGVTVIESWEVAAKASGSPALRESVERWLPRVRAGITPAQALSQDPTFPKTFSNLYQTGELSGKLDHTLNRLRKIYAEEASRGFHAFSVWLPRLIYWVLLLLIAFQIVKFYSGDFRQIDEIIGPAP